jgi:hypothetical protein
MLEEFEILFERSGGFTGNIISVRVDSKTISSAEKEKLLTIVQTSNFFEFKHPENTNKGLPDQFEYRISIKTEKQFRTLQVGESSLPGDFRPLIRYLMLLARNRK